MKLEIVKSEVKEDQQRVFTTTKIIEREFPGKKHKTILTALRELNIFDTWVARQKILPSRYVDSSGKTNIMFELDRDAFSLLVMGFTGKKAEDIKVKFIEEFNRLEQQALSLSKLSPTLQALIAIELQQQQTNEKLTLVENRVKVLEQKSSLVIKEPNLLEAIDPEQFMSVSNFLFHKFGHSLTPAKYSTSGGSARRYADKYNLERRIRPAKGTQPKANLYKVKDLQVMFQKGVI